jgi:hypothetical protein
MQQGFPSLAARAAHTMIDKEISRRAVRPSSGMSIIMM